MATDSWKAVAPLAYGKHLTLAMTEDGAGSSCFVQVFITADQRSGVQWVSSTGASGCRLSQPPGVVVQPAPSLFRRIARWLFGSNNQE